MFRTLMTLLDGVDYTELQSRARKAYEDYLKPFVDFGSSFEEEGDSYVMVLNVPQTTTGENVEVEYDDNDNCLSVSVTYENDNVTYSRTVRETLPSNADVETLSARVVNGVLSVVVDKLPEPEPEMEAEEICSDPTYVEIKRKKKE